MLFNATLLRISDPPPASPGALLNVRCSTGGLTAGESDVLASLGLVGSAVVYLPMSDASRIGSPTVGQHLVVRPDGTTPVTYTVVHVVPRVGVVLRYLQIFVAPVET